MRNDCICMVSGALMSYYENLRSKCPIRDSTSKLYSSLSVLFFVLIDIYFLFPLLGDVIHAKYKKFYKFIFLSEFNKLYGCPIRDSPIRDTKFINQIFNSICVHFQYLYQIIIILLIFTVFNVYLHHLLTFYSIFTVFWSFLQ